MAIQRPKITYAPVSYRSKNCHKGHDRQFLDSVFTLLRTQMSNVETRPLALLFVVLLGMEILTGCSSPQTGMISLLDQIPEDVSAGPWRVVALERNTDFNEQRMSGLERVHGSFVQTDSLSSFVIAAPLMEGERALIRVTYGSRWAGTQDGRKSSAHLQVRIMKGGVTQASARTQLHGWVAEFLLGPVSFGSDSLEIRHCLSPGEPVPLNSIAAIALPKAFVERDLARAKALLAWACRDRNVRSYRGLSYRRFPVSFDMCTRDVLAMADRDTVVFDIPSHCEGRRLQFWIGGLNVPSEGNAELRLEVETKGRWKMVASWKPADVYSQEWSRVLVGRRIRKGWQRTRFILLGSDRLIVGLAEPLLLPSTSAVSDRRNLLLVDLDTMRADRLGCYGYSVRPTSEKLDSLLDAKGFFVFRRAYSAASWTLPATAKFLTSRYLSIEQGNTVPRSSLTLPEILRARGYLLYRLHRGRGSAQPWI